MFMESLRKKEIKRSFVPSFCCYSGDKGQNKYGKNRQVESRYANVRTCLRLTYQAMLHKILDIKYETLGTIISTTTSISHHKKFAFHLFFLDCQSICRVVKNRKITFVSCWESVVVCKFFSPYPIMKRANKNKYKTRNV